MTVANTKFIQISAKVSDRGVYTLLNKDGKELAAKEGYVPFFMPDNDGGDYITLTIDVETGQIQNWNPISVYDLQEYAGEND